MKKRNIIFIAVICLLLSATVVIAAASPYDRLTDATGTMGKAVKSVVTYFFSDGKGGLDTDLILKIIVLLALAVGLFELLTLFKLKRGTAAIVGTLIAVGLILVIPKGVMLAIWTAGGSIVVLLMLALVNAAPTAITYWVKPNVWWKYVLLITMWVVFIGFIYISLGELISKSDIGGWISTLQFLYIGAVILYLAAAALFSGTASIGTVTSTGKAIGARIKNIDEKLAAVINRGIAIETELKKLTSELNSSGVSWSNAQFNTWSTKVIPDLKKLSGILLAERSSADPTVQSEIDLCVQAIDNDPAGPIRLGKVHWAGSSGIAAPNVRPGVLKWIQGLNTAWATASPSIIGPAPNDLSSTAGKTAELKHGASGLVNCLQQLEEWVDSINNHLASK